MAPEPVPEPKFQPLHDVLAEAFSDDSPKIFCAFLESDGKPCGDTVEKTDLNGAKYYVEKVSQYLNYTTETSPLLALLFQLCNYCLCGHHMKHNGHPKSQWLRELKTKALKEKFISLLMANERWPPPPRVLGFKAYQKGKSVETWLETLKRIDKVLKKELKRIDKNYVYVLSSPEAVGKFKIGVCRDHPLEKRTDQHLKCYPSSEMIKYMALPQYAYHVEQLMLAEFKEYHFQLEEPCHVYDHGRHIEWLNVEADVLIGRILEWQEFFIDRPHKMKLFTENGRFNCDAGLLSPPHERPERPTDDTPPKIGRWSSRSPTPRNDSLDPFSRIDKDTEEDSGNTVETLADDTPTKDRRRSSRHFLASPDESRGRSSTKSDDMKGISDQPSQLPECLTPTKPDRGSLCLASSPNVSGLNIGKRAKDKNGSSTESDISENLSMISLTSRRQSRRISAMSQEATVI